MAVDGWIPSLVREDSHHMSLGGRQSHFYRKPTLAFPARMGPECGHVALAWFLLCTHLPRAMQVKEEAAAASGFWSGCAGDRLFVSYLFLLLSHQFCELSVVSLSINSSVFYSPPPTDFVFIFAESFAR